MKVEFLKNAAGFGYAYKAGAKVELAATPENKGKIEKMLKEKVIIPIGEKSVDKAETRAPEKPKKLSTKKNPLVKKSK